MPLSGSSLLKGCKTKMDVGDVDEVHSLKLLVGNLWDIRGFGSGVNVKVSPGDNF